MAWHRSLTLSIAVLSVTCTDLGVYGGRCPSHCDERGRFVASIQCSGELSYCCGNSTYMHCCSDWLFDITRLYSDQCFCTTTNCLYKNWEAIASVVTMVVLFSVVLLCCFVNRCVTRKPLCQNHFCRTSCPTMAQLCSTLSYRCCCSPQGTTTTTTTPEVESGEETRTAADPVFDPSNPYAFTPPDYEAVCKAPPKYEELGYDEPERAPAYTIEENEGAPAYTNDAYITDDDVTPSTSSHLHGNSLAVPDLLCIHSNRASGLHGNDHHSNGGNDSHYIRGNSSYSDLPSISFHNNSSHSNEESGQQRIRENGSHSDLHSVSYHSNNHHSNLGNSLHSIRASSSCADSLYSIGSHSNCSRSNSPHGNSSHGNRSHGKRLKTCRSHNSSSRSSRASSLHGNSCHDNRSPSPRNRTSLSPQDGGHVWGGARRSREGRRAESVSVELDEIYTDEPPPYSEIDERGDNCVVVGERGESCELRVTDSSAAAAGNARAFDEATDCETSDRSKAAEI